MFVWVSAPHTKQPLDHTVLRTGAPCTLTIPFLERGQCVCFAAMELGQQTLPFKKTVILANGQEAICLPHTRPSMLSGFACQLCKLTFKTKQGLAGHKMSLLHKGRMGDQTKVVEAAPTPLVFPATTSSAQSSGTSTPVCSPVTPSSSTANSSCPAASSSIASTRRRKKHYVGVSRAKLTRGASHRKRWSVIQQADIIEAISKFEDSEVEKKSYAVTARLFNVPVGNLSRWWNRRENILEKAEELRQCMLLGVNQRKHLKKLSTLRSYWNYNRSLQPLLKNLENCIVEQQKKKRPVCLGMVHRVCRRKLADLEAMGFPVTFRGQPLKISKTWCWKMMLTLGYTSRRRSKIRPTSVEADILNCFPDVFFYAYEPKVQK